MRYIMKQDINALSRVTPYIDLSRRRIPLNAFFTSHLNCCPLVWMFHSRGKNYKVEGIH